MADKIKMGVAALLAVAGLAAFYYFSGSALVVRIGAVLAGFAAGALVLWTTDPGKRFFVYSQESVAETKKVVWPNRKETLQTTGVVFAFVVVMALFLWIVDASLLWVVQKLMGQGDS
jgi:preprotein translocase subunit SecE